MIKYYAVEDANGRICEHWSRDRAIEDAENFKAENELESGCCDAVLLGLDEDGEQITDEDIELTWHNGTPYKPYLTKKELL